MNQLNVPRIKVKGRQTPINTSVVALMRKFKPNPAGKESNMSLIEIMKDVCKKCEISIIVVQSKSRKREIVEARHFYFKRAKELTKASFEAIGKEAGNRDHATVMHGIKTVNTIFELQTKYWVLFGGQKPERVVKSAEKPSFKVIATITKESILQPLVNPERPVKRVSPYAEVMSCNNIGYHGFREHSL